MFFISLLSLSGEKKIQHPPPPKKNKQTKNTTKTIPYKQTKTQTCGQYVLTAADDCLLPLASCWRERVAKGSVPKL